MTRYILGETTALWCRKLWINYGTWMARLATLWLYVMSVLTKDLIASQFCTYS